MFVSTLSPKVGVGLHKGSKLYCQMFTKFLLEYSFQESQGFQIVKLECKRSHKVISSLFTLGHQGKGHGRGSKFRIVMYR